MALMADTSQISQSIQHGKEDYIPGEYNPLSEEVLYHILDSMGRNQLSASENSEALNHLRKILVMLSSPPEFTTLRINLAKMNLDDAAKNLSIHLMGHSTAKLSSLIYSHPVIHDLIVLKSKVCRNVIPKGKEVIVGQLCGSAVLRGADVFAPGVLGATADLLAGEEVAVYVDIDGKCLRGCKLFEGQKMFVGNGIALQSRSELFRVAKPVGVAVEIKEKLFECPSLRDFHSEIFFLQNLPSVVCGHVLNPEKNGIVLDMCAAPGGKTTHLASLVGNCGQVIAIDRSKKKIEQIKENGAKLGLENIFTFVYDSTKLVDECNASDSAKCQSSANDSESGNSSNARSNWTPPYKPKSFGWIMLDAPCSALGQRPQIQTKCSLKELKSFPIIQRKLLENAVKLLKTGGMLLYSTCSIVPEENEKMVKWVLDSFKDLELIDSQPKIGRPGLSNCGLSFDQCLKVQRFGPFMNESDGTNFTFGDECDNDTIGFFISLFRKLS